METKNAQLSKDPDARKYLTLAETAVVPSRGDGCFRYTPPVTDPTGVNLTYGVMLKGYCSTWDIDCIDDEIVKGAFAESIQRLFIDHTRQFGSPYVKIMNNHEELAAVLHYCHEDDHGVYVEFWCLNTEEGRKFYVEVVSGAINQMSFGFIPLTTAKRFIGEREIRQILTLEWLEASGVLWPCNYATSLGKNSQHPITEKSMPPSDTVEALPADEADVPVEAIKEVTVLKSMCEKICKDCGEMEGGPADSEDHAAIHKACKALCSLAEKACKKVDPEVVESAVGKNSENLSETEDAASTLALENKKSDPKLEELRKFLSAGSSTLDRLRGQ